jgi:hypothetical protein
VIGRHVGHVQHEHEIGAGRDAPALLHGRFGHRTQLKRVQMLGALAVQRDLHQRGEPRRQAVRIQQRHAALDHPGFHQPAHAAQRRGGRSQRTFGQFLVGQSGIGLKQFKQADVGRVEINSIHRLRISTFVG